MPELPEVETTRRALAPALTGKRIRDLVVREPRLRWPIPADLRQQVRGETLLSVRRRAKYLLLDCAAGSAILHLGMSGRVHLLKAAPPPGRHDHVDLLLDGDLCLRFRDPRRFGALLWCPGDALQHPLLAHLGPEPLACPATELADHLCARAHGRKVAVKPFLMNHQVVVGVGNIYASEALFLAGISPGKAAGRLTRPQWSRLAMAVQRVLDDAIAAGGTALRDFRDSDGKPGYFQQQLHVYGRAGEDCPRCGAPVRQRRLGQRSSFYCSQCQR